MAYYPIYLNITNKRCVIVGGGEVGARKAVVLVESGAQVAILSQELTFSLKKMKQEGRIEHIEADYETSYLHGAFMVIGATDSAEVNQSIAADARARGIMVNIADDPARCDFMLPAVLRQGDLVISVSTGGKSPALAKKLRAELEASFGQEYAILLNVLGEVRDAQQAKRCSAETNKNILTALVNSDLLDHVKAGNAAGVHRCIRKVVGRKIKLTGFKTPGKG